MPVFINEITAEVPQGPVPEVQSEATQELSTVTLPEYEFLQSLNLIEERRQRLEFD